MTTFFRTQPVRLPEPRCRKPLAARFAAIVLGMCFSVCINVTIHLYCVCWRMYPRCGAIGPTGVAFLQGYGIEEVQLFTAAPYGAEDDRPVQGTRGTCRVNLR